MLSKSLKNIRVKYSFEEEIDEGMSSSVYRVFFSGNEYALKLFNRDIKDFHFENELRICRLLCTEENPNFIRYISSSEEEKVCNAKFIVFQLAEKGTLDNFITPKMPLKEKNVKTIFWKLVKMVERLHNLGFCHRDLKLGNIFVDQNFDLKLGDFGSSKYFLNQNGESRILIGNVGTPEYAAPEMKNNFPYDGQKVDIYSLGVILLYLRTGKLLFANSKKHSDDISQEKFWDNLSKDCNGLTFPPDFKNLVTSMLDFNYQNRPDFATIFNNSYFDEIRSHENFIAAENELKDAFREIDNFLTIDF